MKGFVQQPIVVLERDLHGWEMLQWASDATNLVVSGNLCREVVFTGLVGING